MIVGKHRNIPDSVFDPVQLRRGIEVEMEHTNDPEIAKQISKDHLNEAHDYYIRLARMEEGMKKGKGYSGGFYHWPRKAPTTLRKRREVAEKGGASRCFLEPEALKFPICDVHGKIDCRGIMAAYKRARQFGHDATAKKALKRARKYRCEWVKHHE